MFLFLLLEFSSFLLLKYIFTHTVGSVFANNQLQLEHAVTVLYIIFGEQTNTGGPKVKLNGLKEGLIKNFDVYSDRARCTRHL